MWSIPLVDGQLYQCCSFSSPSYKQWNLLGRYKLISLISGIALEQKTKFFNFVHCMKHTTVVCLFGFSHMTTILGKIC